MPIGFTKTFAERLDAKSRIKVVEASEGMLVQPNTVYIAKAGFHLEVVKNHNGKVQLSLRDSAMVNHVKPAVDVTLQSAAKIYGKRLISVILTGMGKDGTDGCRIVKKYHGKVIAEDESSCVLYGMPKSVIEAGLADYVVPLPKVLQVIDKLLDEK